MKRGCGYACIIVIILLRGPFLRPGNEASFVQATETLSVHPQLSDGVRTSGQWIRMADYHFREGLSEDVGAEGDT